MISNVVTMQDLLGTSTNFNINPQRQNFLYSNGDCNDSAFGSTHETSQAIQGPSLFSQSQELFQSQPELIDMSQLSPRSKMYYDYVSKKSSVSNPNSTKSLKFPQLKEILMSNVRNKENSETQFMSSVLLNTIEELKSKVNEITGIRKVLEEFKNDYIRQQTGDTRQEMIENITQAILTAMSKTNNDDQTAEKNKILCCLEQVLEALNENKKKLKMSQKLENVEQENSKLIKEVECMKKMQENFIQSQKKMEEEMTKEMQSLHQHLNTFKLSNVTKTDDKLLNQLKLQAKETNKMQENFIQSQKKMENEITKEMQSLHQHLNTFKLSNATKKVDKLLNQLKLQANETKKMQNSINKLLKKKMSCETCPQLLDLINTQLVQPSRDKLVGKANLQSTRKNCKMVKRLEGCTTLDRLGLENQNELVLQNDTSIEAEAIGPQTRSQTAKRKRLEVACCTSAKSGNVRSMPKFIKNANLASTKCHQSSPELIVISSPEQDDLKSPENKTIATRKLEEKACHFKKHGCSYQQDDVANSINSKSFPLRVSPLQNMFSRSVATCSHQRQRHATAESIQMTWSVRKDTYFDSELDDIFG